MQDEINERVVVFSIHTAKLTGELVIEAAKQYLTLQKVHTDNIPHGRQTLKQLMRQNAGVSNIEMSEQNLKPFEIVAKKYGIDYAVEKIESDKDIRHLIFFKGRDADALTAALMEISSMKLSKKPSIKAMLTELKAQLKPPEVKQDLNLVKPKENEQER